MKKHLVHSEEDFMRLFQEWDSQEVEQFLGIEFAYRDGTYQSDFTFDGTTPDDEDQDLDLTRYRRNEESNFPEQYPCLVLLANEKGFDRTGNIGFQLLDFVYLNDFQDIRP